MKREEFLTIDYGLGPPKVKFCYRWKCVTRVENSNMAAVKLGLSATWVRVCENLNMWVGASKWAHLKGIGLYFHNRFWKIEKILKSATRGLFCSAIRRKPKKWHKTQTMAPTCSIKVSIPMFSWSGNSFMQLLRSASNSNSLYSP